MESLSSQRSNFTLNPNELDLGLHPRQLQAILSPATWQLFGGASEGGKSHCERVLCVLFGSLIPNLQIFIYRKFYADCVETHMQGETPFPVLLAPWIQKGWIKITENEIRWPHGSRVTLGQLRTDEDLEKAQGKPKHLLILDESTQIKERHIRVVSGWVRMSLEMKKTLPDYLGHLYPDLSDEQIRGLFPRIFMGANPMGESVGYHRRKFIEPRAPLEIEEVGAFKLQYIPSKITDNPSADPEAQRKRLEDIGDPEIAKALIDGNWEAIAGDFIRQWNAEKHVVPNFTPPQHWFKYRSFDWGGADPAVCYWWCVSDGQKFIDETGRIRWFPEGALIAYREWYICDPNDPAKGIDMRNADMACGIVLRTPEITSGITITDNLPFQRRGDELMAETFAKNGCPLVLGNTDRVMGWKQLKDYLTGQNGIPMLYFTEDCPFAADYIPALQRHKKKVEDAQESGEASHACDAIRLSVMTRPIVKHAPKEPIPTPKGYSTLTPKSILNSVQQRKDRGIRHYR